MLIPQPPNGSFQASPATVEDSGEIQNFSGDTFLFSLTHILIVQGLSRKYSFKSGMGIMQHSPSFQV